MQYMGCGNCYKHMHIPKCLLRILCKCKITGRLYHPLISHTDTLPPWELHWENNHLLKGNCQIRPKCCTSDIFTGPTSYLKIYASDACCNTKVHTHKHIANHQFYELLLAIVPVVQHNMVNSGFHNHIFWVGSILSEKTKPRQISRAHILAPLC